MIVGELFVQLGITGADKNKKALQDTKTGLVDVQSSGLAAKAAIVSVVYAIEKLTSQAAQFGLGVRQFENLTGLSSDGLQRWQYLLRQSGVGAEEATSSLKSLQNVMTDMALGKGIPEGFNLLAGKVGFDPTRIRDTFYVMDKLKQFAQATKDTPDVANHVLRSFGISDATIQALRTTKVEIDKIRPSQIYSQKEIDALARIEIAWMNFWNSIKMLGGHVTSQYGMGFLSVLQYDLKWVVDLSNSFQKLIKQFPELQAVAVAAGLAIGYAFAPLTATVASLMYIVAEMEKYKGGKGSIFDKGGFLNTIPEALDIHPDSEKNKPKPYLPGILGAPRMLGELYSQAREAAINLTVNITGVKNAEVIPGHVGREVKKVIDSKVTGRQN